MTPINAKNVITCITINNKNNNYSIIIILCYEPRLKS